MKQRQHRPAFTLIEVTIVIAIMALLTTAAVISFAGPLRAARVNESVELLRAADADAQRAARGFDQVVTLRLQFDQGLIERLEERKSEAGAAFRATLPGTVRIDQVRIAPTERGFENASIRYSPLGLSPTYAIRIVPDEGPPRWLVFAGLSGQMTVVDDETQVADILSPR